MDFLLLLFLGLLQNEENIKYLKDPGTLLNPSHIVHPSVTCKQLMHVLNAYFDPNGWSASGKRFRSPGCDDREPADTTSTERPDLNLPLAFSEKRTTWGGKHRRKRSTPEEEKELKTVAAYYSSEKR